MANELILIVEVNPKNLKLVRDVLRVRGYRTIEAGTGEEGVQMAREQQPALVLMDIQWPGMSGVEGLQQLRADPVTGALPLIAVTASVMPQDPKRIMAAGFDRLSGQADQCQGATRDGSIDSQQVAPVIAAGRTQR